MTEVYLCTERLALRRVHDADVDNLLLLNADQDVMRFIDRTPPTPQDVRAEVGQILGAYECFPDHGTFIAEDPHGAFLGWFGLTVREGGPTAPDLGYRLRRAAWGQGLATEGSRALVDHAFTHLGAERVTADTMAVNHASRRVMEKCGLRYVRTFHAEFDDPLPGTEHGEVLYEITRDEWAGRHGP
jgi:RimJ/RimL family protein N-acetyltransferase